MHDAGFAELVLQHGGVCVIDYGAAFTANMVLSKHAEGESGDEHAPLVAQPVGDCEERFLHAGDDGMRGIRIADAPHGINALHVEP